MRHQFQAMGEKRDHDPDASTLPEIDSRSGPDHRRRQWRKVAMVRLGRSLARLGAAILAAGFAVAVVTAATAATVIGLPASPASAAPDPSGLVQLSHYA